MWQERQGDSVRDTFFPFSSAFFQVEDAEKKVSLKIAKIDSSAEATTNNQVVNNQLINFVSKIYIIFLLKNKVYIMNHEL